MATVYRCDRCPAEFTDPDKIRQVELPQVVHGEFTDDRDWVLIKDLCSKCVKGLLDTVEKLEPQKMVR